MTLTRGHFSLNTLQWITVGLGDASGDPGDVGLEIDLSSFLPKQPVILGQVRDAGYSAVMLKVLPTQTLQNYARVVADSGLRVSPGYVQIGLPEDFGQDPGRGGALPLVRHHPPPGRGDDVLGPGPRVPRSGHGSGSPGSTSPRRSGSPPTRSGWIAS